MEPLSRPQERDQDRAALVQRWLLLTRRVLPAMARDEGWPISLDHCFMRVCLDEAVGCPWAEVVARPAIRRASIAQLAAAVRVAEGIVERPDTLRALNAKSLAGRETARRVDTLTG